MNECPRSCPQIECLPCSFYGSLPLAYFFPELQLSTIRAYQGYQFPSGMPTWIFGGCTKGSPYLDLAYPTEGYQWAHQRNQPGRNCGSLPDVPAAMTGKRCLANSTP